MVKKRIRVGQFRSRTNVRGHRRKCESGKITWVRHHSKSTRRVDYREVIIKTNRPLQEREQRPKEKSIKDLFTRDKIIDKSLYISSYAFPQYSPIIEPVRLLYKHRHEVLKTVDSLFSKDDFSRKIDQFVEEINQSIPLTKKPTLERVVSRLSEVVVNSACTKLVELGIEDYVYGDSEESLKSFFENTTNKLLSGYI